jgi:AraC-like DNA-binding protein/quercetin dioxygenase-like cupin family protein
MDNTAMTRKQKSPQRASPENRALTALAESQAPFSLGDLVVEIQMAHRLSYAPRFNARDHVHQHLELLFLLRGEIRYRFENRSMVLRPGEMLFIPPRQVHRWRAAAGSMSFIGMVCEVSPAHADPWSIGNRLEEAWSRLQGRVKPEADLSSAWTSLDREVRQRRSNYRETAGLYMSTIATLFFRALREALPRARLPRAELPSAPAEQVVLAAKQFAAAHLMAELSLPRVARAVGVSPRHLYRLFKKIEGCTPGTFILGLKMDGAKKLLRLGKHPVKVVAGICGYRDPDYFSRIFKKHTGKAPTDYA